MSIAGISTVMTLDVKHVTLDIAGLTNPFLGSTIFARNGYWLVIMIKSENKTETIKLIIK